LSVINDGEFFVSGGADSSIIYWADNTKQEEEEQLKAKEQAVLAYVVFSSIDEWNYCLTINKQ